MKPITNILVVAFISELILVSAGYAQSSIDNKTPHVSTMVANIGNQSINILDQTYISNFLSWDFEPINETVWRARYFVDDTLFTDLKVVESKDIYDKDWETLADKYFLDTEATWEPYTPTIAMNLKELRNLPKIATESKDMQFTDIVFNEAQSYGEFYIVFPNGYKDNLTAEFGFGTTLVATGNAGASNYEYSWNDRIVYDTINGRWHIFYIDSGSDIHSSSSADGISWTDGDDIDTGTYNYEDFDIVKDMDVSNAYIHIAYATTGTDWVNYKRCELVDAGTDADYIVCGTEDKAYIAPDFLDDIFFPSIEIDSNDCVVIIVEHEDDSDVTADEHEVTLIREDVTCGDGDIDSGADTQELVGLQTEAGYNAFFPTGLRWFGNLDMQLYWLDTDTSGGYQLETVFFDGDTFSVGTQRTLDDDIEALTGAYNLGAVVWGIGNSTAFGMDDGTTDIDSYRIISADGVLNDQTDTGFNSMTLVSSNTGTLTSVIDTNSTDGDDIWVIAVPADNDDISYFNSTDGGTTWSTPELWHDEIYSSTVEYMSSHYYNGTIMVTWTQAAGVWVDVLNTTLPEDDEPPPEDSCTNDGVGDHTYDCSDNCRNTAVIEMDGSNIYIVGTGTFDTTADIYGFGILRESGTDASNQCIISCNGGCFR